MLDVRPSMRPEWRSRRTLFVPQSTVQHSGSVQQYSQTRLSMSQSSGPGVTAQRRCRHSLSAAGITSNPHNLFLRCLSSCQRKQRARSQTSCRSWRPTSRRSRLRCQAWVCRDKQPSRVDRKRCGTSWCQHWQMQHQRTAQPEYNNSCSDSCCFEILVIYLDRKR